jgi:SAM-dependent methyltransferase
MEMTSPRFGDYLSLAMAKLARLRRLKLAPGRDANCETFYEDFFDAKDLEAGEKDHRKLARQREILSYLKQNVPVGSGVLEVGCGMGELLVALPDTYRLTGMEYAKRNVEIVGKLLGSKARVLQGTIYEIPVEEETQDVCVCLEVLEHVDDDVKAVRELWRVVKPGGLLIASVPYTYYWPDYKKLIGHFRHYTRASFENLLEGNGFSVEAHLANYPGWHTAYARRYFWIRALSMTIGRLWHRGSVYSFRWPWAGRTALQQVAARLEPLRERESRLDYSNMETSTFVAARKRPA